MYNKQLDIHTEKVLFDSKRSKEVKTILHDEEIAKKTLENLEKKIKKHYGMKGFLEEIHIIYNLFKDYINKEYQEIPYGSIVLITAGVVYFLNPFDTVPDFIPGAGYMDDALIIDAIMIELKEDIEKYKEWTDRQNK
jgi:uncharacterized membrane protein YkvA (DUF1232 family)